MNIWKYGDYSNRLMHKNSFMRNNYDNHFRRNCEYLLCCNYCNVWR